MQREGDINMKGIIALGALIVLGAIGIMLFVSWLAACIWNIIMPYLFGLPIVEWWHMLLLGILISILFGRKGVKIVKKS